jgi:hypothetical protein
MNRKRINTLIALTLLALALVACTQQSARPNQPQAIEQWNMGLQVGDQTTVLHEVAYDDGTICSSFTNPYDNSIQEECW